MIKPVSHRGWLLAGVVAWSLLYVSFSGGCLRKWRAKREAAREAARLSESAAATPGVGSDGFGPSEILPDSVRDIERAAPSTDQAPFRGVTGLTGVGDPGLEVAVWTCDDTAFAASRVLARYESRPVPISVGERAAWRQRGIRFVAVPVEEIDALARSTRPLSPVQRQRFGQLTSWAAVVRGPAIKAGAVGPGGAIPAGKPRLIARAWIEPDLSSGVMRRVVRIEAGVQIETGRLPNLLRDSETLGTVSDDGVLVEGLLASFAADGGDAIVLVGESPAINWASLPGEAEDGSGTGLEPVSQTDPARAGMGPSEPMPRSVGEHMLAADAIPARGGRPGVPPRKVLVVLIPRVDAGDGVNDVSPPESP